MTGWGVCATIKAPTEQVLAFVAHHLELGAGRIWLHFDAPDDGGYEAVNAIPRVTAVRCDEAYWQGLIGRRPDKHQNRQSRNMQRVYALADLPWIVHIDVDEYLLPVGDIGTLLDGITADQPVLRVAPWEALHDPALPDDIFTARHFRAALRGGSNTGARDRVFGRYAPLMKDGVLSHAAGKCFFRTGLSRFEPRLHGAFRAGLRVDGGVFSDQLALLHFHAEDPGRWRERLAFRLTRGAYQYNPPLQEWLMAASEPEIEAFFAAVQTVTPAMLARLQDEGILKEADLGLRAKVASFQAVAKATSPQPSAR